MTTHTLYVSNLFIIVTRAYYVQLFHMIQILINYLYINIGHPDHWAHRSPLIILTIIVHHECIKLYWGKVIFINIISYQSKYQLKEIIYKEIVYKFGMLLKHVMITVKIYSLLKMSSHIVYLCK